MKILKPRNLMLAMLGCGAVILGARHWSAIETYAPYKRPSVAPPDKLGAEITASRDQAEARRVETLYQTVSGQLRQAREEDFDVSLLEFKAQEALRLNAGPTRRAAFKMLSEIDMQIPRRHAQVVAAGPGDGDLDEPKPAVPRKVGARKKHRRRRP